MQRTGEFKLKEFLRNTHILYKHPEIFDVDMKEKSDELLNKFENYGKTLNELNDLDKFIDILKEEYSVNNQVVQKIENAKWNEHYYKYDVDDGTNPEYNDMWVFPHNETGKKLMLPMQFYLNCIRMNTAKYESIRLANRNGHMMIVGEGGNDLELGKHITFKILIIYNHKNKKWIVSPFKLTSVPNNLNCTVFAKAATESDVSEQFNIWNNGIDTFGLDLGLVNFRYLSRKFHDSPNLFSEEQTNNLLTKVKSLIRSNDSSDKSPYIDEVKPSEDLSSLSDYQTPTSDITNDKRHKPEPKPKSKPKKSIKGSAKKLPKSKLGGASRKRSVKKSVKKYKRKSIKKR